MPDPNPAVSRSMCCAFCGGRSLEPVIDLGEVALAGGFIKPEQFADEPRFPLRVYFCNDCYAVQVTDIVDARLLFGNYFYFSSATRTLRDHFIDYASEVVARFLPDPAAATVVEIGCNDGVLLKPLADSGVRTLVGVDPAANIVATVNDPRISPVSGDPVARTITFTIPTSPSSRARTSVSSTRKESAD